MKWDLQIENPELTPKQKKIRLWWTKEKQSWSVSDWMKVIFCAQSQFCNEQEADAVIFV